MLSRPSSAESQPLSRPKLNLTKWTPKHYSDMASAMESSFPFTAFATHLNKDPVEVRELFASIIAGPLWREHRNNPSQTSSADSEGERRVKDREKALSAVQGYIENELVRGNASNMQILRAQVLEELGTEINTAAEAKVWEKVRREGWMKIERARDVVASVEREVVAEKNRDASGAGGDAVLGMKVRNKAKSVDEALADFMAAGEALTKAKRAETRRVKNAAKKEEGDRKPGRPKKVKEGYERSGTGKDGYEKIEKGAGSGKGKFV